MAKEYTYSELSRFLECGQKYQYGHDWLYEPKWDGVPKPMGSAFHAAVEALYKGVGKREACVLALEVLRKEIPEYEALPPKEQEKVDVAAHQLQAMIEGYKWANTGELLVMQERVLSTEMGRERVYRGKVDRVVNVNGMWWVHDTKTTGLPFENVVKTMRLRKQFAGYAYLVGRVYDIKVQGVLLDLVSKPRVYLRKDGGVTIQDVTFHREPLSFAKGVFEAWFHEVVDLIEDNVRIENTNSCLAYNRVCPFFEVCRVPFARREHVLATGPFKKREMKHPELEVDDAG